MSPFTRLIHRLFFLMPVLAGMGVLDAKAEQKPISIDSFFTDWNDVAVAYQDQTGAKAGIDFGRLWLADDDRFLFLRLEFGVETDPSENNAVRIYLDTDADSQTGLSIAGIGAELEWRLGDRNGTFYYQGQTTVYHDDLRFRGAPTVTADEFEFAFGRDTFPDGANPLFLGPEVRIFVRDNTDGDQLPEAGEVVSYTFDVGDLPTEMVIPLERNTSNHLRVLTYNVLSDSPWTGQEPRFGRQFAAVNADILSFQEIYNHSAAQTAELVERWVPPEPGESWHYASNNDCKVISRYPILDSWPLNGNLAALIDTNALLGRPLLLINAHLPCCSYEAARQYEIDQIMAFIRDAQQPGGDLDLPANAPIFITGDLNLVGLAQQLTTLLTGDIVNEGTFGFDFAPDWDGTGLTDQISRQTELRMGYTWRSDSSSFWPGHLDYIIYTDSVLEVGNHFILYTPEMSADNLAAYGLVASDSLASDHLLFCADFGLLPQVGDLNCDGSLNALDIDPFVCALNPTCVYEIQHPACDRALADCNADGSINRLDVGSFVDLLVD